MEDSLLVSSLGAENVFPEVLGAGAVHHDRKRYYLADNASVEFRVEEEPSLAGLILYFDANKFLHLAFMPVSVVVPRGDGRHSGVVSVEIDIRRIDDTVENVMIADAVQGFAVVLAVANRISRKSG